MFTHFQRSRQSFTSLIVSFFILFSFVATSSLSIQPAYAAATSETVLDLPEPGTMILSSENHAPASVVGMTIHPDNALKFDFLIDIGEENLGDQAFKKEAELLIKYFLSSLTVPEEELWVNLAPYQKDGIIPYSFGQTEMGRDLLAQDYMLKQLTASLMYPEHELGGEFWKRVQAKAKEKYGTIDINVNTYNKVWIVPENAIVFEEGLSAYIVESRLKVMLEEDYLALASSSLGAITSEDDVDDMQKEINELSAEMVREVLIPEIEREVNSGKNFAKLRQIYSAMILALWYKESLKGSILTQVYVDKNRTVGIEVDDKHIKDKIFGQYLHAFKTGVFNYMKIDIDPLTKEEVPGNYFSGGFTPILADGRFTSELISDQARSAKTDPTKAQAVRSKLNTLSALSRLRTVGVNLEGQENLAVDTLDVNTVTLPVRMSMNSQSVSKMTATLSNMPQVGSANAQSTAEAFVEMANESPQMFQSKDAMIEGLKPRLQAKGISPTLATTVANTVVQPKALQRLEASIGSTVEADTAALPVAIQTDPKGQDNMTNAIAKVTNMSQDQASKVTQAMIKLPSSNFSSQDQLRQGLTDSGVDSSVVNQVFQSDNFSKISAAVIPEKMDSNTASLAVAVKVADTSNLIGVVASMGLKTATPQQVTAAIKSFTPADFSSNDAFKSALVNSNIESSDANIISQQQNVQQIMSSVQNVDPVSASLPSLMAADKSTIQANVALAISEAANIDPVKAAQYAKILVNSNVSDFRTRGSLETSLSSNEGVDRKDAVALTQPNVLSRISIAASSPVDNSFATVVVQARQDPQKSVNNLTAELQDVPEIGGVANANRIARAIVNNISPTATKADFKAAIQSEAKIDNATAEALVQGNTMAKVRRAVSSPVDYGAASVATTAPAAALVNLDSTQSAIQTELVKAGVNPTSAPAVTQAILKMNPKAVSSKQAMQKAFVQAGVDAESADIASQPAVLSSINTAVKQIAPTDATSSTTTQMAGIINANQNSRQNIVSVVTSSNPALDQDEVKFAARQMVVMSQKEPAKFITQAQIKQGLIDREVSPEVAAEVSKLDTLQRIAGAASSDLDSRTASMPAMFQDSVVSQGKIISAYNQMPGISDSQAKVMAEEMINISQNSPESFASPTRLAQKMETQLAAKGVADAPKLASFATQTKAINIVTRAHDQRMFFGNENSPDVKGGIDFNSANIDLSINREGSQMQLPVSQELLDNLNVGGFVPVINNVAPLTTVPLIFGDANVSGDNNLSHLK